METQYDYYLQDDHTKGIRRYLKGSQNGEKWDRETKQWSAECADRRSCELTKDLIIKDSMISKYL